MNKKKITKSFFSDNSQKLTFQFVREVSDVFGRAKMEKNKENS